MRARSLSRSALADDPVVVAPRLLGLVLVCGDRAARIVEVEAYRGADDPASHAALGATPRNATMFGPPGHLYVYRSYGIHWCANVVCGEPGTAAAVLLRAGAPLRGVDAMRAARAAARRDVDLCSGPGKLCQALGIDGDDDGIDLLAPRSRATLVDDGARLDGAIVQTRRVGISRAVERPWRWFVEGDPNVSSPRRGAGPSSRGVAVDPAVGHRRIGARGGEAVTR